MRFLVFSLLLVVGLTVGARAYRLFVSPSIAAPLLGQWVYLDELPWDEASTGWLAVANRDSPAVDAAFSGKPISIAGTAFEKGLGTYPLSQITYKLDGEYALFQAYIGVNDDSPDGSSAAQFIVMTDGIPVYTSGPVRRGDPSQRVELFVWGAGELRLVVQAGADAGAVYADWADAKLLRPLVGGQEDAASNAWRQVEAQLRARASLREMDRSLAAGISSNIARIFQGLPLPDGQGTGDGLSQENDVADVASGEHVSGTFDSQRGQLLLGNDLVGIALGYGGNRHGQLTLLQRTTGQVLLYGATPAIELGPDEHLDLNRDTEPEDFSFNAITDPVFGSGQEVNVSLRARDGRPWQVRVHLAMFDSQPYVLARMSVSSTDGREVASPRFRFFQGLTPNLMLGGDLEYTTDFSRLRHGTVPDDGLLRREAMGNGKPLYLWSDQGQSGLLLSLIDETEAVNRFSVQVEPGQVRGKLGLAAGRLARETGSTATSPTLYIEPATARDVRDPFRTYRDLMARRYPALDLPEWVKYQWLTWYVYYMDYTEDELRHQIDYIAENLADLGPWHIIVDAGWYVAEGREGANWRNVDPDKFPEGLRSLVDYAHGRGVRVVLYFSAPYLDSRQRQGDWLGLRDIIEQHPDWLVSLGADGSHESYVYDFNNPGLREYIRDVMEDFFVKYDVDGIKIDGLGNAEGALVAPDNLDGFGLVETAWGQTMEIYRFIYDNAMQHKPDAYIESGWMTPLFANRYAQTFRYGDERGAFSSNYPMPGLVEHIDYAVAQKQMIGQRPNMGAIMYDMDNAQVNRWWLGAALALGTQVSLSVDLPRLSDERLSDYRAFLAQYDPFKGETRVSGFLRPDVFVTTRDGVSYLGLLNRGNEAREFAVGLAEYGLDQAKTYAAYDVEEKKFRRVKGTLRATLPPTSFRLIVLRDRPGVMWTNSSFEGQETSDGLEITVGGPASLAGHMTVYAPGTIAVYLDDKPLPRAHQVHLSPGTFSYNSKTGVVRLAYEHDGFFTRSILDRVKDGTQNIRIEVRRP